MTKVRLRPIKVGCGKSDKGTSAKDPSRAHLHKLCELGAAKGEPLAIPVGVVHWGRSGRGGLAPAFAASPLNAALLPLSLPWLCGVGRVRRRRPVGRAARTPGIFPSPNLPEALAGFLGPLQPSVRPVRAVSDG